MAEKKPLSIAEINKEIRSKFAKTNPDIIFDPNKQYEVISSGNVAYDLVSGIGGFPRGRMTEITAFESTGKTSLLLAAIGAAQKKGLRCVLFDYEQCFDPYYAESCYGVVLDGKTFFLYQPITLEEGDHIFDLLMNCSDNIDAMFFDSIACMKPDCIVKGSLESAAQIGIHARGIARFMDKLRPAAYLKNMAVVCTNQIKFQIKRDQFTQGVGLATGITYNDPYTTPGGLSPRFTASIRMKLEFAGKSKDDETVDPLTGETTTDMTNTRLVKIVNIKNKCSRPELKAITHFDLVTDAQKGGWNAGKDIMALLKKRGRITQSGAMFKYHGLNIPEVSVKGKAAGEAYFLNTPEVLNDAMALFDQLRKDDTNRYLLVDKAVLGKDILEDEKKGQEAPRGLNSPDETEAPVMISAAGDISL